MKMSSLCSGEEEGTSGRIGEAERVNSKELKGGF